MEIGRTEIVWNQPTPQFARTVEVDYVFERHQIFKVECRDADDAKGSQFDPLGESQFTLGAVVGAYKGKLSLKLMLQGVQQGIVKIRAEDVSDKQELVRLQFCGFNLSQDFLFIKERPYFEIYKQSKQVNCPKKGSL